MDYSAVGGKPKGMASGNVWNFGYIPQAHRSDAQHEAVADSIAAMPRFGIVGAQAEVDRVCIFELWKHPDVVAALGFEFTGTHQLTGSCVGAGGGNALFSIAAVEVIRLKEPEKIIVPFWLLPYGRSRYYLGDSGQGEGSTGSTFAKAAHDDGVIPADAPGLPSFTHDDGLIWGERAEMSWSDGDAQQTMDRLPESRKHLVQTTAQCRDADAVREALCNYYPVTCASNYAHDGGKVQGNPPVLVGRHSGSWSHQMSMHGWWKHPELGELFYLMNQWGLDAHGTDPSGAPRGGVWITKADVDWICRDEGEVFAFSQFQGFPAQKFSWGLGDER